MCLKQRQRPRFSLSGSAGIITAALIAVEPMVSIVGIHRYIRMRRINRFDITHRDMGIEPAKVQDRRHCGRQAIGVNDAATIITAGAGDTLCIRGTKPGQQSTKTVADHANLAVFTQVGDRGLQISHGLRHIKLPPGYANAAHHVVLLVTQLQPCFDPVKNGWRNREIAVTGITVTDFANM